MARETFQEHSTRMFKASLHLFVLVPVLPCINSYLSLVLYPSFFTFLIDPSKDGLYSESFYTFPIGFSLVRD